MQSYKVEVTNDPLLDLAEEFSSNLDTMYHQSSMNAMVEPTCVTMPPEEFGADFVADLSSIYPTKIESSLDAAMHHHMEPSCIISAPTSSEEHVDDVHDFLEGIDFSPMSPAHVTTYWPEQ